MSMRNTLYRNFGFILAMVVFLFLVTWFAVHREHLAKVAAGEALEMSDNTAQIRFQLMQNRLYLSNYLLSGDSREIDHMNAGFRSLNDELQHGLRLASSDQQHSALESVGKNETDWLSDFAQPMMQKRREVDAGNATVADLQIFYLQKDAATWLKNSTDPLNVADNETRHILEERRKTDESAGTWTVIVACISTCVALVLGVVIAYKTSHSITNPLSSLIKVARQIGETGDLDHEIDIRRDDEIGQLARTFGAMVTYLKEMAGVSEAIAGGNLSVDAQPRSKNDILGNAFAKMTEGLRGLVRNVRDAASQVASAATQVAGASDESAKISLQTSSAIDEVTSTMHEMSVNVQNMVKSTQVQASSVSETSASIDQMVASIQRVA
ncbi:MAG: HAMP domain-containing protein, partial [Acidobacteria bacterium]|nr:HAMP domain-containing protein [Acidobacteriota bacterium]